MNKAVGAIGMRVNRKKEEVQKLLKDISPIEQKHFASYLDCFSEMFYLAATLQPPELEPKLYRSKLVALFDSMGLHNVTTFSNPDGWTNDAIVSYGIKLNELARAQHGLSGAPRDWNKVDLLSLAEYLRVLSVYVRISFNILDEGRNATVYKFKTAYKNLADVISAIIIEFDNEKYNNLHSEVMDFLKYQKNVISTVTIAQNLRRDVRQAREIIYAVHLQRG